MICNYLRRLDSGFRRNDGNCSVEFLTLDSGLAVIPDSTPGRNDG